MTDTRKYLIQRMLEGYYLMQWKTHATGVKNYRLFDAAGNSVESIQFKTVATIDKFIDPRIKIFQKDKIGKITLKRSMIRKLNGNNEIKKLYKKQLKKETDAKNIIKIH